MPSMRRRTVLAGAVGAGLGTAGGGVVAWSQYEQRNDVDLRLFARNETGLSIDLSVRVRTRDDSFDRETTVELPPADPDTLTARSTEDTRGRGHTERIHGPWMKSNREYEITAFAGDQEVHADNTEIRSRADADGWGLVVADVTVVFRRDGTLDTVVEPREES